MVGASINGNLMKFNIKISLALIATLLVVGIAVAQTPSSAASATIAPAPLAATTQGAYITGTLNAQFTVSSTEVSVPFYRDVIGLEVVPTTACCLGAGGYFYKDRLAPGRGGSPAPSSAETPSPPAANGPGPAGPPGGMGGLTGVVGGMPRFVRMVVPGGVIWKIQLIEMTNVERRPVNPRRQDIGAAGFIIYVRDLDVTLAAMKKAGTPIVTTGGQPVHIGAKHSNSRAIMARDPDGFSIEVRQLDPLPPTNVAATSNVIGVGMSVSIQDTAQTVRYWRDIFNFELQPDKDFSSDKNTLALYGTPGAKVRKTVAHHPNAPVEWEFLEFKNIERRMLAPRIQDPGNGAFVLLTGDVAALFNRVKMEPTAKILSNGGEFMPPANGGNGAFFFQDLNGFILEGCKGCGIGQQ